MEKLTNQYNMYKRLMIVFVFAMAAAGCGKLDNLDADDFDFFGDDEKVVAELRRYSFPGMSDAPIVQYIVDDANQQSKDYEKDVQKTCDYAKLPFNSVEISSWNASPSIPSTARVICLLDTKKLNPASINILMEFVATGGTLFLPFANEDRRAAFLMGFRPEAEFETDIKSKGFLFKVPMLPNLKDKTYNEEGIHYGWAKENFGTNVRILATSINNPEFPLIVENRIGKGKVVLYNTTQAFTKIDRGLLFSGMLKGLEAIPYPIANTSTIFLDDFPSPLYNAKEEPIKAEMNLTITDFVKKVWWPDMEFLAKKYNISYAAMICFDYKNKTQPPFLFDQWNENKMKENRKIEPVSEWLVKDVAKKGHELAFHGYNHVEFLKGEWPNPEFIPTALKAVQKKWQVSNFGDFPVTYVPPSNHIDKDGVNYLHQGMPSIKYMCSLYLGGIEDGGGREYDFDPYNKEMFDYPRISSGFYMDTQTKYAHESMYIFTGIWTHFVHPDDIYQIDRPGNNSQGDDELRNSRNLGWRKTKGKDYGLYSEFDGYLKQMSVTYPQMRYVNGGEGGKIVNDWRASKFKHSSQDGTYTVTEVNPSTSISDKQYWFLYGSYENTPKIEAQLRTQAASYSKTPYMEGYLFTAYTNKPTLTLRDLKYKAPGQVEMDAKISKKVKDDYKKYLTGVKRFISGGNVAEEEDPDVKLDREMESLKKRITNEVKLDSAAWNKYARYLVTQDRAEEVWKMLGEFCVKYPAKENIMYSKTLSKIIEYPNELTKEKWLSAQLLITPNDKDLLNSYIADFYTPENQEKIRNALVNLLKVDTSFGTYIQYIEHLLAYDQPEALKELNDKKPAAEFKDVASDVAWLFANDGQFQKAYDWAALNDEIDFPAKMDWLIEMKNLKLLEAEYKKYIVKNPGDFSAKAKMATVYHDNDRFRDSWILANSLPESPEKDELRKMLNTDVMFVDETLQQELIADHSPLFYPEVLEKLTKTYRKERGDFIAYNNVTESNKNDPAAFKNIVTYNRYDSKGRLHSYGATYSTMYKVDVKVKDEDNLTHAIGGLQYQFNSAKTDEKLNYWARIRAEYSDFQKLYGQFAAGANIAKAKSYQSAELKIFPMETGPSHSKMIYRTQLNVYQDYYFWKLINASLSLEGNFYTNSLGNRAVSIGKSYEGSATAKIGWDSGVDKKFKFIPFVEGTITQASIGAHTVDPSLGYPYWMIDDRLYGGGGIGWKYGLEDQNLQARVEAAWFADDYTNDFQRFTGEIAWQLFDYTQITASFEVYAQEKFYSNAIQFGVKYNLKKRNTK
jgi:hypothetical protein